jgi:hypothetical protein
MTFMRVHGRIYIGLLKDSKNEVQIVEVSNSGVEFNYRSSTLLLCNIGSVIASEV